MASTLPHLEPAVTKANSYEKALKRQRAATISLSYFQAEPTQRAATIQQPTLTTILQNTPAIARSRKRRANPTFHTKILSNGTWCAPKSPLKPKQALPAPTTDNQQCPKWTEVSPKPH